MKNSDSIHVICRFRPPKKSEIENHGQSGTMEGIIISQDRGTVEMQADYEKKIFTFDKMFGIEATQKDIFKDIEEIVHSIILGFNGTVLAYGQTSSGKTHTMEGPSLRDINDQGVIPRTIEKLFYEISQSDVNTSFTVSVSYFEIYCERLRDLLNPQQDNMKIREKSDGFAIQDITEIYCTDVDGVMEIIEMGKAHRATSPTLMNAESSRSHSLLSIVVNQKNEVTGRHKRGKLFMVDLAGSEKVSKTGAKGARLEEAKNINRSLTTLGMVINSLCDGSPHIPYRDSKLTRVLTESLGGNSKTTLIICCAPELRHLPETISTLRFGERAKRIKNNAKVNEELSARELKVMLQAARIEIASLKKQLLAAGLQIQPLQIHSTHSSSSDLSVTSNSLNIDNGEDDDTTTIMTVSNTTGNNSNLNHPDIAPMSTFALLQAKEQAEEEVRSLTVRLQELAEEVETERVTVVAEVAAKMTYAAEVQALQTTIVELENKLLDAKSITRKGSHSFVLSSPLSHTPSTSSPARPSSSTPHSDRGDGGGGGGSSKGGGGAESGSRTRGLVSRISGMMTSSPGPAMESEMDTSAPKSRFRFGSGTGSGSGSASPSIFTTLSLPEEKEEDDEEKEGNISTTATATAKLMNSPSRVSQRNESTVLTTSTSKSTSTTTTTAATPASPRFQMSPRQFSSSFSTNAPPTTPTTAAAAFSTEPFSPGRRAGTTTTSTATVLSPSTPTPDSKFTRTGSLKTAVFSTSTVVSTEASNTNGSSNVDGSRNDTGATTASAATSSGTGAASSPSPFPLPAPPHQGSSSASEDRSSSSGTAAPPTATQRLRSLATRSSSSELLSHGSVSASGAETDESPSTAELLQEVSKQLALGDNDTDTDTQLSEQVKALSQNLLAKEQETRRAEQAASEYAEQYGRLREEYDCHVQRLMMKLSHEQHARSEVEDRLEMAMQKLWKRPSEPTNYMDYDPAGNANENESYDNSHQTHRRASHAQQQQKPHHRRSSTDAFFSLFGRTSSSSTVTNSDTKERKTSISSTDHSVSTTTTTRSSPLGPVSAIANTFRSSALQRERDLSRTVSLQEVKIANLSAELEATRDAQQIVLETKETVMRSLLRQNVAVTQERDELSQRVDTLTASVAQLQSLLKNLQQFHLSESAQGGRPRSMTLSMHRHIKGGGGVAVEEISGRGAAAASKAAIPGIREQSTVA